MDETRPTEEEIAFEAGLRAAGRRRRLAAVAVGALLAGGVATAVVLWPEAPASRCEPEGARVLLDEDEVPAEALFEVCDLPAALAGTLRAMTAAGPFEHPLLAMQMVADAPQLVTGICADAPRAVAEAAALERSAQSAAFLARCDLGGTGLGSPESLAAAELHRLVLAVAVLAALRDSDPGLALPLARRMLRSSR